MKLIEIVASHRTKPSLAIPDRGTMLAIDLIAENNKMSILSYVLLCPTQPKDLYHQFQSHYKNSDTKWLGRIGDSNKHSFRVRVNLGEITNRAILSYYFGNLAENEMKHYRLKPSQKSMTICHISLECDALDSLMRKQSEFTILL
ncbi:MAG: hypothetical protein KIT45_13815 [Fimbriimonadia bacterium]|nr:hypothetical protein [Fimbriimonadia bacterium]